ncbi:hypothetical protein [Frankia sp. AgB32]|uniref:hypothetical protein n=1 Tax=Frankia sp. AgB32 TaxID=631119 RepID=UPI00200F837D|nr:hypothetical protein [Frankia sp. AgB32]MCK9895121.1 hypothetical protein [Frankia sp. AgB32]
MTVCGLARLDGADVRRAALTAMLAASARGLPAARGVHLDGVFGAVTAADTDDDPTPPVAVDEAGLVVIADLEPLPVGPRRSPPVAHRIAERAARRGAAAQTITVVWEPTRCRLLLARPSATRSELITWTDGRVFVFGTELDQIRAAGLAVGGTRRSPPRWLARGEVLTVRVPARRRPQRLVVVPPRASAASARDAAPCQ